MCKQHVPTIEERRTAWINKFGSSSDELSLISSSVVYPDSAASDKKHVSRIAGMCRYKMNQGVPKEEEKEPTVDDLLLDGISEEFPGEECVIKGLRRPNDNTLRHLRDSRAKSRHKEMMWYAWSYEPINRAENGKYNHLNLDEFRSSVVATKKKSKSEAATFFNRVNRRKSRHEGKAECGRYTPEMFSDDFEDEELCEIFPEKADGTIDLDAYLAEEEYEDFEEFESYEEYLEGENSQLTRENSRLKREINLYKDFIGEFNLGKLHQTWLAANGKGAM